MLETELSDKGSFTFLPLDLVNTDFIVDHFLTLDDADDVADSFNTAVVDVESNVRLEV